MQNRILVTYKDKFIAKIAMWHIIVLYALGVGYMVDVFHMIIAGFDSKFVTTTDLFYSFVLFVLSITPQIIPYIVNSLLKTKPALYIHLIATIAISAWCLYEYFDIPKGDAQGGIAIVVIPIGLSTFFLMSAISLKLLDMLFILIIKLGKNK